MKAVVNKKLLSAALDYAATVAQRKGVVDPMSTVMLEVLGDKLGVCATDRKMDYYTELPISGAKPGAVCVNAVDAAQQVRSMDGDEVLLQLSGRLLKMSGYSSYAKLAVAPVEDFIKPLFPLDEAQWLTIKPGFLERMLKRIGKTGDEDLEMFSSVVVSITSVGEAHRIDLASFDNTALSIDGAACEASDDLVGDHFLPIGAVGHLTKFVAGAQSDIRIGISSSGSEFFASYDGSTLCLRMLELEVPQFRGLLGFEHDHYVTLKKRDILRCLKSSVQLAHGTKQATKISVKNSVIEIIHENKDRGEIRHVIEVNQDLGTIRFGLDAQWLSRLIGLVNGDDVVLGITGEHLPMYIKEPGNADMLMLIMPMRNV